MITGEHPVFNEGITSTAGIQKHQIAQLFPVTAARQGKSEQPEQS